MLSTKPLAVPTRGRVDLPQTWLPPLRPSHPSRGPDLRHRIREAHQVMLLPPIAAVQVAAQELLGVGSDERGNRGRAELAGDGTESDRHAGDRLMPRRRRDASPVSAHELIVVVVARAI